MSEFEREPLLPRLLAAGKRPPARGRWHGGFQHLPSPLRPRYAALSPTLRPLMAHDWTRSERERMNARDQDPFRCALPHQRRSSERDAATILSPPPEPVAASPPAALTHVAATSVQSSFPIILCGYYYARLGNNLARRFVFMSGTRMQSGCREAPSKGCKRSKSNDPHHRKDDRTRDRNRHQHGLVEYADRVSRIERRGTRISPGPRPSNSRCPAAPPARAARSSRACRYGCAAFRRWREARTIAASCRAAH